MSGGYKLIANNSGLDVKKAKKILMQGNTVTISIGNNSFDGLQVKLLLEKLNYVIKRYGKKCKIINLISDNFCPKDKMTYIILEVIIYELINTYKKGVYLTFKEVNININTYGLNESLLYQLICRKIDFQVFKMAFERRSRVCLNSFRRVVKIDDAMDISKLMTDTKSFLKPFQIEKDDCSKIARIVSELADNACEHAKSECLIDIDVSEDYIKKGDLDGQYYSINICGVNFSDVLLGQPLKKKIIEKQFQDSKKYEDIAKAYENHKEMFDNNYTDEHFFVLASFQDNISGREMEINTGGRGLAEIVGELEKRVDVHECYVMTGNKVVFFQPDNLEIDDNGWISFNKEKDFIKCKPSYNVTTYSDTNLCGTGYNLTLIYKRSS